jgi:mRNA interferase MazF
MVSSYIPERGDMIWISFDPQAGKEITKTRPALVLSPSTYNRKTSLCLVVPISSKTKNFPFEVKLNHPAIQGVILADQVRSLDWRARQAVLIGQVETGLVADVIACFSTLIQG